MFERYSLPQRRGLCDVGRVWSFRDVTERARAEEAMARLVAIIEATPDFVATSDALGHPLYINRAGRRMVGLGLDEPLAERHIAEFHPPLAAARLLEEAIPTALREGVWSGENSLRHHDGREIPVLQVVLAHHSPGGEVDFLSTIARDISQRIEAEQELRRSHTMAALGSLVAGVAHEVRNPLFGISSTLDAFEARFRGRDDHRSYVAVLRQQLDRLTSLMNDLLEYAKPTRLELEQGRLEDVVAQTRDACAPLQERAAVTIDARFAPDLPPLRMDPRRLGQVFRNLLENALQHSPRAATSVSRPAASSSRAPPGSSAPSRTTAPDSRARTCSTSSSPSSPDVTAEPGSASRSSRESSPTTAAPSPPRTVIEGGARLTPLAPRHAVAGGRAVTVPRFGRACESALVATAAVVSVPGSARGRHAAEGGGPAPSDALQLALAMGAAAACFEAPRAEAVARARSGRPSGWGVCRGLAARSSG